MRDSNLKAELVERDLAASKLAERDVASQRDVLVAQKSHWEDVQKTQLQVEHLVKLLENTSSRDNEDAKKAQERAAFLDGEVAALRQLHSEQDAKIATFQKATASSKHTILNAQQRASEWEKKAIERQQEAEEYRRQLEESNVAREATMDEISHLNARLQRFDEGERESSVCLFP